MPQQSGQTLSRSPSHPTPDAPGEISLRASILDALGEAVVGTDRRGRIVYWNNAAERLYGWGAPDAVGVRVGELLVADPAAIDARAVQRTISRGESWSGDLMVRDSRGRIFPVLATTTPIRDGSGAIVGMAGITRDISQQREAERALQDTTERLELVHRAAESVIWERDLQTGGGRFSDSLATTFGYTPERCDGSAAWWIERIHPEDRERVTTGLDDAVHAGRRFWTDEYRFRKADGDYATVFDRGYLSVDSQDRPLRMVGTMLDLTDRRRSNEARRFLAQSGMLLELSLDYEAALPGIAQLAVTGVADYCFITVLDAGGRPAVVTAAGADPVLDGWVRDRADEIRSGEAEDPVLARVLREGEALFLPRLPRTDEAAPSPRSVVAAPLVARGATLGVVCFGMARRAAEFTEEELRVVEELGRRIGLAVDNARLFHRAELANRAKTDFLSVVSHELRTPLTAVLGYADLLDAQVSGPLNELQKNQVARIRAGSDRLLRLIETILSFARLETGRERIHPEKVSIGPLIKHVEEIIRPQALERLVGFESLCDDPTETITADPDKLVQILLALLVNGLKFATEGRVRLHCHRHSRTLCFDVSDTGPGIPPEHAPRVFSPFWQAEQPEVRRAGGAGLGLSTARQLARLMGGDVALLDGTPGRTTFRLTIPAGETA